MIIIDLNENKKVKPGNGDHVAASKWNRFWLITLAILVSLSTVCMGTAFLAGILAIITIPNH